MSFKNKWLLGICFVFFLLLFWCVIGPFLRQTHLRWQLAKVDVSPILIQEGDLPSGFTAGNIKEIEPDYFQWDQAKKQEILASDGTTIGTVSAFLFASDDDQSEMYSMYRQVESREGIIPYEVSGIGDCETCKPIFSISGCDIRVVFTRCTAVGVIELDAGCSQREYNFDDLVTHAKRLDESLKSIACY